jgi:deazaflavin-dependent oxidoreductase (nitroreductase family)
MELEARIESV